MYEIPTPLSTAYHETPIYWPFGPSSEPYTPLSSTTLSTTYHETPTAAPPTILLQQLGLLFFPMFIRPILTKQGYHDCHAGVCRCLLPRSLAVGYEQKRTEPPNPRPSCDKWIICSTAVAHYHPRVYSSLAEAVEDQYVS